MKVKSIVFNSTCLLSPNSSKDRELLNSWWTRTRIVQNCPVDTGTIMIDFEKAVMNAIQNSLPGWEVSNCYFHLCQAVQKNISKKFKVLYYSDKIFARAARLVIVFLAFVTVADVEEVFYEITYYIQANYPQLMVVVNYFQNTYLGSVTVDSEVKVPPKFPLAFWNHYSKTLEDPEFPRTSNMVESFHRGFKSRVNRPKPTVQEYFRAMSISRGSQLSGISIDWFPVVGADRISQAISMLIS